MSCRAIGPAALQHLIDSVRAGRSAAELAVLDVREEGEFGEGHLLWAINAPYSRLELLIEAWVPRRSCPIVLVGQGSHAVVELATRRLLAMGYTDVQWLAGGVQAWAAQNGELFKGVYVPSKTFGEWVEHHLRTPTLGPQELHKRQARGDDVVVLDPRTLAEHAVRHIPGARPCPGGELLRHFKDLVPNSTSQVVLACGGRTRGIMAAQTLVEAGVENPVAALTDGNHGWVLAGFTLEYGTPKALAAPSRAALEYGSQRAAALALKGNTRLVAAEQLKAWLVDPARTTYLLDVRDPDSYAASHLQGSRSAPGGQLLQALDRWVAVLGARLVLIDDDSTRAQPIAYWLQAMGWPTWVLEGGLQAVTSAGLQVLEMQPAATATALGADEAAAVHPQVGRPRFAGVEIEPMQAAQRLAAGAHAWVFDTSADYLRRHPAGSRWANRAHMRGPLNQAAAGQALLLFSDNGDAAHLAAIDLAEAAQQAGVLPDIWVVRGGIRAWGHAGLGLASASIESLAGERVDFLAWAARRRHGDQGAMRQYLDWERQLLAQLARDGSSFHLPGSIA